MSNKNNCQSSTVPGEGWSNSSLPPQMYTHTQDGLQKLYSTQRRYIHTSHGWSRNGSSDPNDKVGKASSSSRVDHKNEAQAIKSLMSQLSEKFFQCGWQPGTGGGMSIRMGDGSSQDPFRVFSTPSGIQKEDMTGHDVFELDMDQNVLQIPETPGLKLSSMTNLWFVVYNLRPSTMCVIHTHSMYAQLATMLDPTESMKVLRLTHLEMIKGVGNHAYDDLLEIPIIENQTSEDKLAPDLAKVISMYPKCNAVLVRRHGVYVWGDSWEQAKTQLESFDYLFETAVRMKSMGIDCSVVPRQHSISSHIVKRPLDAIYANGLSHAAALANYQALPQKYSNVNTTLTAAQTYKKRKEVTNNTLQTHHYQQHLQYPQPQLPTPSLLPLRSQHPFILPKLPRDSDIVILTLSGCIVPYNFVTNVLYPFILKYLDSYLDNLNNTKISELMFKLKVDTTCYLKKEDKIKSSNKNANNSSNKNASSTLLDLTLLDLTKKRTIMKIYIKAMIKYKSQTPEFADFTSSLLNYVGPEVTAELFSCIYKDIQTFFEYCKRHGIYLYLYSSESKVMQDLVLRNTDLSKYISSNHDSISIGPTSSTASYVNLQNTLKISDTNWKKTVFISESTKELEVAASSGLGYPVLCHKREPSSLSSSSSGPMQQNVDDNERNNASLKDSPFPILKGLMAMAWPWLTNKVK